MKKLFTFLIIVAFFSCKKQSSEPSTPVGSFYYSSITVNGISNTSLVFYNVPTSPTIEIAFTHPINPATAGNYLSFTNSVSGQSVPSNFSYQAGDSAVIIQATSPLVFLSKYKVVISPGLKDMAGDTLPASAITVNLNTTIDSSSKFPQISDTALLTLVQQQTFNYFWTLANPVSGMAQERTSSGTTCATGGTGFGVMSILAAINRNFITRTQGLTRIQTLVSFLTNNCTRYHGAFSHWINGSTGATVLLAHRMMGGIL